MTGPGPPAHRRPAGHETMSARLARQVASRLQAVAPARLEILARGETVVFRTTIAGALRDGGDFVEDLVENVPMEGDDREERAGAVAAHLYGVLDQFQDAVVELLRVPLAGPADGTLALAYAEVEDWGEVRLGFAAGDEPVLDVATLEIPELGL